MRRASVRRRKFSKAKWFQRCSLYLWLWSWPRQVLITFTSIKAKMVNFTLKQRGATTKLRKWEDGTLRNGEISASCGSYPLPRTWQRNVDVTISLLDRTALRQNAGTVGKISDVSGRFEKLVVSLSHFSRYCRHYIRCDKTQSPPKFILQQCQDDLFWNPSLATVPLPGGACDFWWNLPDDVRTEYEKDRNCRKPSRRLCKYGQFHGDECTGNYFFQTTPPITKPVEFSCTKDLIYDPADESCKRCEDLPACSGKGICP